MKLIKFKYILLLIILMAMVSAMACKTKTSGETKPKLYYTIEGEVKNPAGIAVQNVRVEVANYTMVDSSADKPTDLFATLTDADGAFTLELLAYDDVAKVTLKLTKDGLTTNYVNVGVIKGLTVTVSALIAPAGGYQTIDATQDTTVTGTGGATVTISAGTLRDSEGRAASAARVSVAAIDSTADRTLLPGSLYGMDGGSVKLFSTFGMLEINVIDAAGDPMHLASGATAAVSIPVGDIVGANPSATVGLWYFNEESSTWLLEGALTLNDAKTAYNGTISHLSLYNAGETWDLSFIKIRVVDQGGDPVVGAVATFFKEMFSDNGVWQESYTTGPEGYVPSILSNELKGIVPDNMAGYLPLPAGADLNVRIKYIKTSDSKKPVFLFPDPSPDPAGGAAEIKYELTAIDPETGEIITDPETGDPVMVDQEDIPIPYTFRTAAAGGITPFGNVALQLETNAFLKGHVQFENGDPATGWFRFMTSTDTADQLALAQINADGDLEWVKGTSWPFTYTYDKTVRMPANTEGFIIITTGPPTGGVEYLSWFVNGGGTLDNNDDYVGDNGGPNIAKWYTTPDKGVTDTMVITLKGGGGETGPVEVAHTYLTGTARLANGDLAPEGSWVVFNGMSSGAPVVIRAKVGANGVFPDPTGPFSSTVTVIDGVVAPVKVDSEGQLVAYVEPDWIPVRINEEGDLETIIGEEWEVLEEDAVFYVELVAGITYENTQLLDVTTDPLNPDVLFTYEYEAEAKDKYTTLVLRPVTTVSGRVYRDGGIGADLLVTFILDDAVTECVEEGEDGYDEDCEVDEPVTAVTDEFGAYSVDLEIDRDYGVGVWEYYTASDNTKVATVLLTAVSYASLEDGSDDELDITIGAEYQPVARVTGTVVYEGAYGEGLFVKFTTTTPSLDTVIAIVGEEGEYSANLDPATEYSVTVYEVLDGDALYPSVTYPVDGDVLLFTSSDINSPVDGEEDELDIQIGAGMGGDEIYLIPAGSAGVKGIVENADGTYPSGMYVSFNGAFALIDDEGTFGEWAYGTGRTRDFMPLTPDTEYTVKVEDYSAYPTITTLFEMTYTSPAVGVLETLKLLIPASGGTQTTNAYVKGIVKNADGTYPSGMYVSFNGAFALIDDEGTFGEWAYGTGRTKDYMPLTPDTEYTVKVEDYSAYPTITTLFEMTYTSPPEGVMETLKLLIPAEGGTQTTNAYIRGVVMFADGTIPSATSYGRYSDGTTTKYTRIDQDNGEMLELSAGAPTGNAFLQLLPNTTYTFSWGETTSTQTEYLTVTTPASGVVKSISIEVPNP